MELNGVMMQYQSDPLFANEIMTFPEWQKKPDIIKDFGCLLIAKLNCRNLFFKNINYMTIQQLNDKMQIFKGYYYDYFKMKYPNNISLQKKYCFGKESFAKRNILNHILCIENEISEYTGHINIASKNDFYIVRTKYEKTGHYSMVIDDSLAYLDSYDGKVKNGENILDVYKITF